MTTAHRPTFDPAKGKESLTGPAYHQRLLPAHTQLKYRQPGQGGAAAALVENRDLAAELLAAEAAHYSKKTGRALPSTNEDEDEDEDMVDSGLNPPTKRALPPPSTVDGGDSGGEDLETKRRRILEQSRDIDADSSGDDADSSDSEDSESDSEDDSDDDEQEELMRELERVKREKALKREKEEAERRAAEEDQRTKDIALGNPLLNSQTQQKQDFTMKRRWDDDVVFKNQARGTDDRGKQKEFVNDMLRSDFHKRFMGKYVR